MATVAFDKTVIGNSSSPVERASFWDRVFARFVAAREAEARLKIATYVANLSDEHLTNLGLTPRDIELLRHPSARSSLIEPL